MAGLGDTYVVHCAQTECDLGLRASKLVLEKSHGVYLKDKAQVTVRDKLADKNVICFGGCISAVNPKTIEAAKKIAREVEAETGMDFEAEVADMFTSDGGDGRQVMACAGECKPVIVSVKWDKEKEDVWTAPSKNALLGEATLTCKYGGIIKITMAGQPE